MAIRNSQPGGGCVAWYRDISNVRLGLLLLPLFIAIYYSANLSQ